MKLLSIICLAGLLGACALVPESIKLSPTVVSNLSQIGRGKTVAVTIIDARANTVIGGRPGGFGSEHATISVSNNVSKAVRASVYSLLKDNNFTPVVANKSQTGIIVRITKLDYSNAGGILGDHLNISAVITVSAHNSGRHYSKVYRGTHQAGLFMTPTTSQDSQRINQVLGWSLTKLASDTKLMHFLAG